MAHKDTAKKLSGWLLGWLGHIANVQSVCTMILGIGAGFWAWARGWPWQAAIVVFMALCFSLSGILLAYRKYRGGETAKAFVIGFGSPIIGTVLIVVVMKLCGIPWPMYKVVVEHQAGGQIAPAQIASDCSANFNGSYVGGDITQNCLETTQKGATATERTQ